MVDEDPEVAVVAFDVVVRDVDVSVLEPDVRVSDDATDDDAVVVDAVVDDTVVDDTVVDDATVDGEPDEPVSGLAQPAASLVPLGTTQTREHFPQFFSHRLSSQHP